jgi:hypothetical protein
MAGGAVVMTVVVAVGSVAYLQHQTDGLLAATIALLVCLLGVMTARLIGLLLPQRFVHGQGILLSMLLRMAIPLGICLVALLNGSQFLQFGFAYYLVVFYQLTLVIDVSWSIARLKQPLAS